MSNCNCEGWHNEKDCINTIEKEGVVRKKDFDKKMERYFIEIKQWLLDLKEKEGWQSPEMIKEKVIKLKIELHNKTLRHIGVLSFRNLATVGGPSKYKRYIEIADGIATLEQFWSIIDNKIEEVFQVKKQNERKGTIL